MSDKDKFFVKIGVAVMLVALTLFTFANVIRRESDITDVNREGITCVLEQLNEHRQNSYAADRDQATSVGRPFNVPAPAPRQLPLELAKSCEKFLKAR